MQIELNQQIAKKLFQAAEVLERQNANRYRVQAYRKAGSTIRNLDTSVADILETKGLAGLDELPNIGRGISRAIYEMVSSGFWAQLERMRGSLEPEYLFQTVPGVGPALAKRIFDTLGVDSLESLEIAAHDGRLEKVPGVGSRRAAAIRAGVSDLLANRIKQGKRAPKKEPPIDLLLAVDQEYRQRAEEGTLERIAPKRFNPTGEPWLPILHSNRGDWQFTALFSNTARAHELHRTHDWVVIYFYDNEHREGQRTIVSERQGGLAGKRVVRGREAECRPFYEQSHDMNSRRSA